MYVTKHQSQLDSPYRPSDCNPDRHFRHTDMEPESGPDSRRPNQARTRGSLPTDRQVTESAFATWQLNSSCLNLIVVYYSYYRLE